MTNIEIDAREVRELAADLTEVNANLVRHVRPIVSKGAHNIMTRLRAEMAQSRYFSGKGGNVQHISYDLEDDGYSAEIGPEKGGIGSLANIAYFGGAAGGGGSVPDPIEALQEEIPKFEKEVSDLIQDLKL